MGNSSATFTFWASDGPLFVTARFQVMVSPAITGSGFTVLMTDRSASVSTATVSPAVLFDGSASAVA